MTQSSVTVLGGGVIGLACAYEIAKDGTSVTLVDAGEPRFGTSSHNNGWVAPSHVIPFAAPGMVKAGVEQMVKRTGAFTVSPSAGPAIAGWTLKFMRSCTEEHVRSSVPALTELLDHTITGLDGLINHEGLKRTQEPLWYVFTGEHAEEEAQHEIDLMDRYGVGVKPIEINTARNSEPVLKETAKAVVEFTTDFGIDPNALVKLLTKLCTAKGVTIRSNEMVTKVAATRSNVSITTDRDSWSSDYVVLAAGVWSRELAKSLGSNLNIVPAKGHSITIPNMTNQPKRPMMLARERIAANSLDWGFRLSTGYTLTSTKDRSIETKAIEKLVQRASEIFDIPTGTENIHPWTGLRPSSPDGMPYIGPLGNAPRVIAATGHGMLGTMMSMGTAKIVADMVAGRATSREMMKFLPTRP